MALDHAAIIVNHLRSIMGNSEWRFHGPSVERIVCKAIDDAREDAVIEDRAAQQAAAKAAMESK